MIKTKRTATQAIRAALYGAGGSWLAVHEITASARADGDYISDNAAASRLCMELKGEVEGRFRDGCRYKEWRLAHNEGAAW